MPERTHHGMQVIDDLGNLPAQRQCAVIINCATRMTTTLALASLRAATDMPILLIDCASKDGSREHFSGLASRHGLDFFWLDWPLRKHGHALDALLAGIPAEEVLLVDSDVDIRSGEVIARMQAALTADAQAYAAGFRHGPQWLGAEHGLPDAVGHYAERMWIPLVLLRWRRCARHSQPGPASSSIAISSSFHAIHACRARWPCASGCRDCA